ncbi:uncharacterized protein [Diabrotica undecimpunctata]|uniref:uncharacterized protein n=1 Tax=Diabrotica undecimpunctata TaxID=50387 RepID=UPI003B63A598
MSSDEDLMCWLLLENNVLKTRRRKRTWIHKCNEDRSSGEFNKTFQTLRNYPDKFKEYHRMSIETFYYILEGIEDNISGQSNFRECISPEEKLNITIRYLATGMSFRSLGLTFRMNDYTVGKCVSSVVDAIWNNFYERHLSVPDQKEFEQIAVEFNERWNFIHAIGCIDGKHIRIKCPKQSGTTYFNYKKYFSVVLQAVADYRCRFLFVDVGGYGKQHDGQTFTASTLSTFLENCHNTLPQPLPIEGIATNMPLLCLEPMLIL